MKRDKYKNNKIDSIWNLALLLQCASILSKSRRELIGNKYECIICLRIMSVYKA